MHPGRRGPGPPCQAFLGFESASEAGSAAAVKGFGLGWWGKRAQVGRPFPPRGCMTF